MPHIDENFAENCPLTYEEIREATTFSMVCPAELRLATAAYEKGRRAGLEEAAAIAEAKRIEFRFEREDRGDVGDESFEIADETRAKLADMDRSEPRTEGE